MKPFLSCIIKGHIAGRVSREVTVARVPPKTGAFSDLATGPSLVASLIPQKKDGMQ
jgi:hypothetical protein